MNKIYLTGSIGFSWWDEDYFTAKDVREQLEGLSGPLTVYLNSGGGIATEGQAIYAALKNYAGEVTIVIEGIAASAASLIAMAGDHIIMPLGSIMMIHDPAQWCGDGRGTEADHQAIADQLSVIANAYAAIYAARSGMSQEAAREIMKAETYYDGAAAVAAGFATRADEASTAQPAASFDYRLYQHAPKGLHQVAANLSVKRSPAAVIAMMAGQPKTLTMESNMPKITGPRARSKTPQMIQEPLEDDEEILSNELDQDDPEADLDQEEIDLIDEEDEEDDAGGEGAAPSAAMLRYAQKHQIPQATLSRYAAAGLNIQQLMAICPPKGTNMSMNRPPVSRSQMLRDERQTRRAGMTEALHAQMTRASAVSGAARPYMNMSIVEMAALASGQRGAQMRSWGDRERVLMSGMATTSDFPAIFQNALNKTLVERYSEFTPTYRQISRQKNFADLRPMPLVRAGDFPTLKPVPESGEIKFATFGESGEQAVILPYASGVNISRQMLINDELGAIQDVLSNYGETIAFFEENVFYSIALSAKLSSGKALFHTDHSNIGQAAAISVTSISDGRAAMRKQKSIDKRSLNLSPNILLVGPNKETEAEMVVAAITPQSAADANPFSGKLQPVVSAEITGDEWYLVSSRAPGFVYGYLEGAEAPRIRTEEPFGRQGFAMTIEHDFGVGVSDFRGIYKNPGA